MNAETPPTAETEIDTLLYGLPNLTGGELVAMYLKSVDPELVEFLKVDHVGQTVSHPHFMYGDVWNADFTLAPDNKSVRSLRLTLEADCEGEAEIVHQVVHDFGCRATANNAPSYGETHRPASETVTFRLTIDGRSQFVVEYGLAAPASAGRLAA